mgnify:CR=1 FL=1
MAIRAVTTISTGLVGVYPRLIYIATDDTITGVSATGYLNKWNLMNPGQLVDGDMALVITKTTPSAVNVDSTFLQVNNASGNWSLIQSNGPGSVTLPTIADHIAVYTNTTGGLSDDASTAINGGNIQAGLSGTSGVFASFPPAAGNGALLLAATNAGGAFNTVISNGVMGQATVYTLPDIGAASGNIMVSTTALRTKVVVGAAAAGGAAAQSFTDAFCTTGSNVIGNWRTQANAASVLTIAPGDGSFVVTSSANAGVGTFSYTITK